MSKPYNIIDLFCGCGGFSLGFRQAGFDVRLGIDLWNDAVTTYKRNFPEAVAINEDIRNVSGKTITDLLGITCEDIDVIIGGPPCQGFSLSGKRDEDDPRNVLYKSFVEIVRSIKPKIFVMENVPGLVRLFDGKALESVIADFSGLGYNVSHKILSSDAYGVPQQRRRVFFVGINREKIKRTTEFIFPDQTNGNGTEKALLTCKDAISDLDFVPDDRVLGEDIAYRLPASTEYQKKMRSGSSRLLNHSITMHTGKTKEIIAMVPDGCNYKTLPRELWSTRKVNIAWTRMDSKKPCFTIDTGHNHHFHYRANRVPTVRESARIQSFPDNFEFIGIKTSQLKQVGNAVPPLLAEAVALQIKNVLDKEYKVMYDHTRQYRCTIIRGKSQSEMDNLLPLYAQVIDTICPCTQEDFASKFNDVFSGALSTPSITKTLDNHRTEIAGRLFGMYYTFTDGMVYASERTRKFLSDNDTPAFFKDICYKMQFPNGSQKWTTVEKRINYGICIRQFPFILKVLLLAENNGITLTKKEIGYYILNSLDVLQGKADPQEVVDAIRNDRQNLISHDLGSSSYAIQHINEQINLLELANLIIVHNGEVSLNPHEMNTIHIFAERYADKPEFDVYSYNLSDSDERKLFYSDWNRYFSQTSSMVDSFDTTAEALGITIKSSSDEVDEAPPTPSESLSSEEVTAPEVIVESSTAEDAKSPSLSSKQEIGDEGERYVYQYEKQRVKAFNFRLAGKVVHLGKTHGLGYDIQSVIAIKGDEAEFVKYIEVKATKRVTAPDITDSSWIDTFNITRNEWIAAKQHGSLYSIFRVYFVRGSVIMFVLTDIMKKHEDGKIQAVPTTYRVDFNNDSVDEVIYPAGGAADGS